MSHLIIEDKTLLIITSLAVKIGLNEAVMLQQVHYWLSKSQHWIEGRKWVYNTYEDWHKQMPFWSVSTIKRTVKVLEKSGYLISERFNHSRMDQTKWYTIDYEKLADVARETGEVQVDSLEDQEEFVFEQERSVEGSTMTNPIPESTSENTSKKKDILPIIEIIAYLNRKANTAYRPNSRKTRKFITARFRDGFTLEDFKKVIDLKTAEWLKDPKWNKYLRPETLFGTKFESYLNQKPERKRMREEDLDLHD
ncbi:conserved phage C-terminal domain-containing protein [Bacillus sp. V5-8f]|uniref:conserved phage C-terminal domain-containing protein n=1 Tax=Bacillus sp. V5-8f TaxID=2053044 RepID=UPI000C770EE7|nr:conserved phage C-terminal domain-containing protein [Bacillus sp. V5-8f]PLT33504.1 replication protein [Bacillus sp. V5-8f]